MPHNRPERAGILRRRSRESVKDKSSEPELEVNIRKLVRASASVWQTAVPWGAGASAIVQSARLEAVAQHVSEVSESLSSGRS